MTFFFWPKEQKISSLDKIFFSILFFAVLPFGSLIVYLYMGSVNMPDFPMAQKEKILNDIVKDQPISQFSKDLQTQNALNLMIEDLEARLQKEPQHFKSKKLLARIYSRLNQFDQAEKHYLELLSPQQFKKEKQNKTIINEVIGDYAEMLVFAAQDFVEDNAKILFEQVIFNDSADSRALYYLGLYHFQRQNPEKANTYWQQISTKGRKGLDWKKQAESLQKNM